jgi:hypothetical protein
LVLCRVFITHGAVFVGTSHLDGGGDEECRRDGAAEAGGDVL